MNKLKINEDQQRTVASRLLAKAIKQQVEEIRIGLRADALPLFVPDLFYEELMAILPANSTRVGLLGFERIAEESERFTHLVETAVRWRNDATHDEKLIIILNPVEEQQKVHSLHMLEPFTDDLFYENICRQGAENAADGSLIQAVWQSLRTKQTKQTLSLVSGQVVAFYAELEAGTAVATALATLHLLPDNDIAQYKDSLANRFEKQNKELLTWLDELDKTGMRVLARVLANDDTNEMSKAFGLIKQYRAKKSTENLANLSLQLVQKIKDTPKQKQTPIPNTFKHKSASQALVNDLLSLPTITDEAEIDLLLIELEQQAEQASTGFHKSLTGLSL